MLCLRSCIHSITDRQTSRQADRQHTHYWTLSVGSQGISCAVAQMCPYFCAGVIDSAHSLDDNEWDSANNKGFQ